MTKNACIKEAQEKIRQARDLVLRVQDEHKTKEGKEHLETTIERKMVEERADKAQKFLREACLLLDRACGEGDAGC